MRRVVGRDRGNVNRFIWLDWSRRKRGYGGGC